MVEAGCRLGSVGALGGRMAGAAACFITPDLYLSCTWSWIPTSPTASGAEGEGGEGGRPGGTDPASLCFLCGSGRRRAGCHGSLRRLWSSWYASLSAPLSTRWPRATPNASSRRSSQQAKWTEGRPAVTSKHQEPRRSSAPDLALIPHLHP